MNGLMVELYILLQCCKSLNVSIPNQADLEKGVLSMSLRKDHGRKNHLKQSLSK